MSCIYLKQSAAKNITVLSVYADKTVKIAWYDRFSKKVLLANGVPNNRMDGFDTRMAMKISPDELNSFVKALGTINLNDLNTRVILGNGKNWKKQDTQLVIRTGEFGNLELVRMYAEFEDDSDDELVIFEDDPDPVDDESIIIGKKNWKDEFEKFVLSKKDKLEKFEVKLRELYKKILDDGRVTTVTQKLLPSVPSTPLVPPSEIAESSKRKAGQDFIKPIKKRPKNNKQLLNEVSESIDEALCILFYYMKETGKGVKECILSHEKEMNKQLPNKIDFIRDIYQKIETSEIEMLYRECNKKGV